MVSCLVQADRANGKTSYLPVFYSRTLANIFVKIGFIKLTLIIPKMIKKK